MTVDFIEDVTKMGWAIQFTVVECLLVAVNHTLNTVDSRVENIAVQGKTVRCTVDVGWDSSTESIQVDHLV